MRGLEFAVVIAIALAGMSAPASAKEPRWVDYSSKSVEELSGCLALKLAEYPSYRILKKASPSGLELRMKFGVFGVAATAATFIVTDEGERRKLVVFATGRADGAPRTIAEGARTCI